MKSKEFSLNNNSFADLFTKYFYIIFTNNNN